MDPLYECGDTIIARTVNATELHLADARLGIPARMLEDDRELTRALEAECDSVGAAVALMDVLSIQERVV